MSAAESLGCSQQNRILENGVNLETLKLLLFLFGELMTSYCSRNLCYDHSNTNISRSSHNNRCSTEKHTIQFTHHQDSGKSYLYHVENFELIVKLTVIITNHHYTTHRKRSKEPPNKCTRITTYQFFLHSCNHASRQMSYNKPTRCTNFSNLFWKETPLVSDSSSVHHMEFFTVHTAMVRVIQVFLTACKQDPDPACVQ